MSRYLGARRLAGHFLHSWLRACRASRAWSGSLELHTPRSSRKNIAAAKSKQELHPSLDESMLSADRGDLSTPTGEEAFDCSCLSFCSTKSLRFWMFFCSLAIRAKHCVTDFLTTGYLSSLPSHAVCSCWGSWVRATCTAAFSATNSFSSSTAVESSFGGTLNPDYQAQTENFATNWAPGFWWLFRLVRESNRGCFACSTGLPKAN